MSGGQYPQRRGGHPMARVSPASCHASPVRGPRCGNPKRFSRGVARSAIPDGATAGSRRSPPCCASAGRFCRATPPAVTCPSGPACASGRRPPVKRAPHSRSASSPSSSTVWEGSYRPASQAKAGGTATARAWSTAREAPGLIPRPDRRLSASRRRRGRGAASPGRGAWGCAMPAPGCS